MATVWIDNVGRAPKSWLLTDGTIAEEPTLEVSGGGRRVRLKDDPDTSAWSKDIETLVFNAVKRAAEHNGTRPWVALGETDKQQYQEMTRAVQKLPKDIERDEISPLVDGKPASLHITDGNRYNKETQVYWEYRHDSLPLRAVVVANMKSSHRTYGRRAGQALDIALVYPDTTLDNAHEVTFHRKTNPITDSWFALSGDYSDSSERTKKALARKPLFLGDATEMLGSEEHQSDRRAAIELATLTRLMEETDSIYIPDLRHPENPGFLELQFERGNVTSEFKNALDIFVEGGSAAEQLADLYTQMRSVLQGVGMVVPDKSDDDFARALGGDTTEFTVEVNHVADEDSTYDSNHTVIIDIASGTIIVNCSKRDIPHEEVATAWELALTKAEITGKEDELLAFARKYAEDEQRQRTQRILDERRGER